MTDEHIDLKIQDLGTTDRFEAIRDLMQGLAVTAGMDPETASGIESEIVEREQLTSTAIGNGVAIPHARVESVSNVRVILGRSEAGIPWDAPDGKLVHLVFQFVSPKIGIQIHTEMLAKIAQLASEREFDQVTVKNLRSNELWELLDENAAD